MTFPLVQRPGAVAFLDDDGQYLEVLGAVMPSHWHVELFSRPQPFIEQLQGEVSIWEADALKQQDIVTHWREGRPILKQILEYWHTDALRYSLTRVCLVDYAMPGKNGLQVLGDVTQWPGLRVLLTGQADERLGVSAFNDGLINQFIPKQLADITRRIAGTITDLLARPPGRLEDIWRSTLSPEQALLLADADVADGLRSLIGGRWVEYILIGQPFGVLGLREDGKIDWLKLETREGLADLADLAQTQGIDTDQVRQILTGTRLSDLEMRQSAGLGGEAVLQPAVPVGADTALLGAFFELDAGIHVPAGQSYRAWLSRHAQRALRE